MNETVELDQLLVRMLEMLRMHQEALFKGTLAVNATVEAMKESDPGFAAAYDRHFWEMKQGELGKEHAIAVRMIDQLKQEVRDASGRAAGAP